MKNNYMYFTVRDIRLNRLSLKDLTVVPEVEYINAINELRSAILDYMLVNSSDNLFKLNTVLDKYYMGEPHNEIIDG